MPSGGEIEIDARQASQADGSLAVVVRFADSGPGMPAEARARVFEPFFSTKDEGTGLGLCIAARIMERHGGRLTLEPAGNRGTTFAAWIPTVSRES
jgi:signal transduction histidine kinase